MFSTTSLYTKAGFQVNQNIEWNMLTEDQCEVIVLTAMEILERTGADVLCAEARKTLADYGCWVDGDRVRVPSHKMEKALAAAPSRLTLCDRNGKRAIMMEAGTPHYGTGFGCKEVVDVASGEVRAIAKQDVADVAKICGGLENIDFVMDNGAPTDVPAAAAEVHAFEAIVSNTVKPVVQEVKNAKQAEAIMKMAFAVAGGEEKFAQNPFAAIVVENEEALCISAEAASVVAAAAAKGFPVVFSNKLITGFTAPEESAGAIVAGLVNSLLALVLAEATAEGAPFITGGFYTINDMDNEMNPYGAPEISLINAGFAGVLRYLKVPSFGFGGGSDSKISDAQMGLEACLSLVHAGLAGTNLIYGAGIMETGNVASPYLLVIGDEIMGMTRRIMRGVEMDEDRLCRGVIDDVQPGGHYLGSEHTRYYFKDEQFWPKLMNRNRIDDWTAAGAKSLGQRAAEMTQQLLSVAAPQLLDDAVAAELKKIVADAEASL